ncbi:hypothetical protein BH09BAC1_BH09BAC1_21490 [soil metagenome]
MIKWYTFMLTMVALLYTAPAQSQTDMEYYPASAPDRHRTVIGFGPASFWSPTMKFEQGIGNWVSVGFHGKARFVIWEGGKIEPFVRVYFTEKSPEGPFIQIKGSFGAYRRKFDFNDCYTDANGVLICNNNDHEFFRSFGGGMAGGYQFFFGKKDHFALDLFGGFQYIHQGFDRYSQYNYWRRVFINFPVDVGVRLGVAF